jgi:hypothetical protein
VVSTLSAAAVERVAALRTRSPQAVRLATLVSTAVRVEHSLLRLARLSLTDADVGAERDLWHSDVLAGASPLALTLQADVAAVLRVDLAQLPAAQRDAALDLVDGAHADGHWSVRLEERMHRLEVACAPVHEQEELLLAAVGELQRAAAEPGSEQERIDIARWLLAALARLPASVGGGGAGFAAAAAGGLHLDRRSPVASSLPEGEQEQWLAWLLASSASGQPVPVGVRFTTGRLELFASGSDVATIELPRTQPIVLDLEVAGRVGRRTTRLHLQPDIPISVAVEADEVVLSSLGGSRWLVRRGGVPPVAGFDFSTRRVSLRPCLAREEAVAQTVDAVRGGAWWTVVTGPPGIGTSTVLNAACDELEARHEAVVVQHFYGVEPAWDAPSAVVASIEAQLRSTLGPNAELPTSDEADDPRRRLTEVLYRASEQSSGGIVVAIDGLPGSSPDDVKAALFSHLPFPSQPPRGVRFLVSTPFAGGLRDWLEDGDPWRPIDLAAMPSEPVCRAMLQQAGPMLAVAFSASRQRVAVPSEASGAVDVSAYLVAPPFGDELLSLSGANPGRLAGMLDWIGGQPPDTVTLDGLPAPLAGRFDEAWEAADRLGITFATMAVLAAARPGCTVSDVLCVFAEQDISPENRVYDAGPLVATLREATGLFRVGPAADDLDAEVGVVDDSVRAALEGKFGPNWLADAHRWLAAVWTDGPLSPATPYQLLNGSYHAARAARPDGATSSTDEAVDDAVWTDLRFLARLVRLGGVAAARASLAAAPVGDRDLTSTLDRALATVAPLADAAPELAAGLLAAEWVRLGRRADELGEPRWPLPLTLERIVDLDSVPPDWWHEMVAPVAATTATSVFVGAHDGVREVDGRSGTVRRDLVGPEAPRLVAADSGRVVVSDGTTVSVFAAGETTLVTLGRVTALGLTAGGVAVGYVDGTLSLHPAGSSRVVLAGHQGAVTAIVALPGAFATASVDGSVRVWEPDGRLRRIYRRHRHPVRYLAAALHDGTGVVLLSADDGGVVRCWRPLQGGEVMLLAGHRTGVTGLVTGGAGALSTSLDGAVQWWDLRGGEHRTLRADGPAVVAATSTLGAGLDAPSDFLGVTAEADGMLRWWQPELGELRAVRPAGVVGPVSQLLGCGSLAVLVHAAGVAALSLPTATGDDDRAASLALDRTGGRALASVPGAVVEVDLGTGEVVGRTTDEVAGGRLALALVDYPDLARLGDDGRLAIGRVERVAEDITRIAGDPDRSRVVAAHTDGSVEAIAYPSLERHQIAPAGAAVTALASPGAGALVGRADGSVVLEHPPPTEPFRLPVAPSALAFVGGEPAFVVAGAEDGTVWRVNVGEGIVAASGWMVPLGRHDGPVTGLAVVDATGGPETKMVPPARRSLAMTCSGDGVVQAWDVVSGGRVAAVAVPAGVATLQAAGWLVAARTDDGDLWVMRARPATALDASALTGAIHIASATVEIAVRTPLSNPPTEVSLSMGLGASRDVDLVAVEVDLLPPLVRVSHTVRLRLGERANLPSVSTPLHEPVPLSTELRHLAVAAVFTGLGQSHAITVRLTVDTPDAGGPVVLVATGLLTSQRTDDGRVVLGLDGELRFDGTLASADPATADPSSADPEDR